MNIRIAVAALALGLLATAAHAAPTSNGAGWYVVADSMGGLFVYKGPFATRESCQSARPQDTDLEVFDCAYLSTRPAWDK